VIVSVAEAERVESANDMAVTLTVAGDGNVAGAVYTPAVEIVPTVALPPAIVLTCQVTCVLSVSPTVAVKDCVLPLPACRLPLAGDTETVTGEGTVMAVRQAFVPAVAGAELVAAVEPTVTVARSILPASSVTVSVTLNVPLAGAVTVVEGPAGFVTGCAGSLLIH